MAHNTEGAAISISRSPAAARMRLHRERRRHGLRCLMIELRETEIACGRPKLAPNDDVVSRHADNFE